MTTKHYAPIPDVTAHGQVPRNRHAVALVDTLRISSVDLSPHVPERRIHLAHDDIGALSLTAEQAAQLEDRLAEAREDVDEAEDGVPITDGGALVVPARCECCGSRMEPGTHVATAWDDDRGELVMHWGRCPEPAPCGRAAVDGRCERHQEVTSG